MARVVQGDFEWDSAKAERNLREHGVSFRAASTVFEDPYAVDAPRLLGSSAFRADWNVTHAQGTIRRSR
jgi:uncharacterized DUF497 family protein